MKAGEELSYKRWLRFFALALALAFLFTIPGYGAGLFDGLLPTPTPKPTPVPTPTPTPIPTQSPISLDPSGASLEAVFTALGCKTTVSEENGKTILTIIGIDYKTFVAALILIESSDFESVAYDSGNCTIVFKLANAPEKNTPEQEKSTPAPTKKPSSVREPEYCPDCIDGDCEECFGEGTIYCNAYGCNGGDCLICFGGYVTEMHGLDIREVRCRTCGGDGYIYD